MVDLIITTLRDDGHAAFHAYDVLSATQLAIALEQCDVVIGNTKVEGFDGVALILYLRKRKPDLPIIYHAKRRSVHPRAGGPASGRRLAEGLVKQLTGGDTVSARKLYSEFFQFRPEFKLWLAANHKPVIRGTDQAIWRRIRLIPFTVTIPEQEQDPDLVRKLTAELPGILRWAVDGCLAWQRSRLGAASSTERD